MKRDLSLRIVEVKPSWLKLLILLIIGLPPITGYPITIFMTPENSLSNILLWIGYGSFIWLFILLNVGLKQLFQYLTFPFTLALITVFLGALFRKGLSFILGNPETDSEYISFKMLSLFVVMISIMPYTLFFINCFSVSSYISSLSFDTGKNYKYKIHLALALRVFQHVGEVFSNLIVVWREENPIMFKPRFREDLAASRYSILWQLSWLKNSAITWCFALLMHTFEAIPYLSEEMRSITNKKHNPKINHDGK